MIGFLAGDTAVGVRIIATSEELDFINLILLVEINNVS
jgi:hypothetical protein